MQRSAKGVLVPRVVIALRPTKEITPPFHTPIPEWYAQDLHLASGYLHTVSL